MGKESPKFNKSSLNLAYLQDIADGNAEFMIEMMDIFLKQTPAYLAEIDQALRVEDWRSVAEISHKIRPTFAFSKSLELL